MRRAPSLQRRLGLGVGLGLAALLLLGAVLVALALRHAGERLLLDRLAHDLDSLIAGVALIEGAPQLTEDRLTLIYRQPYSGHYYRIAHGGQVLRSRSLWDADFALPPLHTGARWHGRADGPDGQRLIVLAQALRTPQGPLVVAVAEDLAPLDALVGPLLRAVGAFAATTLVLLLAAQWVAVRAALRPLARLQNELQRLEQGEQDRLPTHALPAEVLPLVERLNAALALLMARLQRSRKAAGNLAHALKTPLALLTHAVDALPDASLQARLREPLDELQATLERELRRARLAGGAGLQERCRPHEVLSALIATLQRIHREREVEVELTVPPELRLPVDREDLLELAGVLLDNAFQWSRGRVRVSVTDGSAPSLSVEDDGPGVAEAELPRLLERGARLDESRAGSGLGLAIAQDIAFHYGGALELDRSALGGLRVRVKLPGRPRAARA